MALPTAGDPAALGGKARRHLRALGHHLRPVVLVGKGGLTASLVAAARTALDDHELIKIKLGENAEGERDSLAAALAGQTGSEMVGAIGRTLLLYRRHPTDPKIVLPGGSKRAPATSKKATARKKAASSKKPASGKPLASGKQKVRRGLSATGITKKR